MQESNYVANSLYVMYVTLSSSSGPHVWQTGLCAAPDRLLNSMEKYNYIVTKDYFMSTSHHGEIVLHQVMEKQNRLEYLRDVGAQTDKKFNVTGSNCGGIAHNRLTRVHGKVFPLQQNTILFTSHSCMGKKVPSCNMESSE